MKDAERDISHQILYTANWLEANFRDLLRPYGITIQQYQALRVILESDQMVNHSFLKKTVVEKDADISRLVNRLVKNGLITKSNVAGDKRQRKLRLSLRGRELMEKLDHLPERMDGLYDHLSQDEQEQLSRILIKLHSE